VKGFSHFLTLGLLGAALMVACPRAGAQQFGLSVTPSANSILVSNSLTYTINVTNVGVSLGDAVVTNFLPASAQFQSASPGYSQVGNNVIVFDLGQFLTGNSAQLTVTAIPTAVGFITNTVIVASTDSGLTNRVSASVVVQVTNTVIQADLGVAMTGPRQPVITNDWMVYGVTVTNAGPGTVPNVMLTNTLPAGVLLKGILPANLTYSLAGSNMIFNLGTLANGGYTNLQFTVSPTNTGVLPFSTSVGAPMLMDPNPANNFASTNIAVTNYLSGPLSVSTNSGQAYDPQNGLVEQSIVVMNNTNYTAGAVRVVVAGLTSTNFLFNAVGTNNGNPFVYYSTSFPAGQSVSLLLQYAASAYFPLTNGQLQAFVVPVPNLDPPAMTATSTNINISRVVKLANGDMLIEWPSTVGQTYTVVYSDNILFSNAVIAPPSIVASANRTQWIDYGPPTTVSAPTNAGVRFYRVYQNP
jgi:uncharacterized repeat protein (TIGR01451 family)